MAYLLEKLREELSKQNVIEFFWRNLSLGNSMLYVQKIYKINYIENCLFENNGQNNL